MTKVTCTLHEEQYTFLIISSSVLLRIKNVSDKKCRENQNTYLSSVTFFFFRKSFRLRDNVEKYVVERDGPQMTIRRMRIARWIFKSADTQLQYSILIAFATTTMAARTRLNVTSYVHCLLYFSNVN